jgi:hypothetical protein
MVGSLLLFLLVLAVLVAFSDALAARIIVEDDFTGTDGDPPDPSKWEQHNTDAQSTVSLKSNTLKCNAPQKWPSARTITPITSNNMEMTVEWVPRKVDNEMCVIVFKTNVAGTWKNRFFLAYRPDWGWHYYTYFDDPPTIYKSNVVNVVKDKWYTINVTVWDNNFNITVKELGTGNVKWSITDKSSPPFLSDNKIGLAVGGSTACYDNFKLWDLSRPPNEPPMWFPLPHQHAVEDVPFVYDFWNDVTDPDDDHDSLSLTSQSPYVTSIVDLEVTFEFPNGVTSANVTLVVSDTFLTAAGVVNFTIMPVNDAPFHSMKREHIATENVPLILDFTPYVGDVDNETSELYLKVQDLYGSAEGLVLNVTFPEGVVSHELLALLSDGLAETPIPLSFTVVAVDDAPTIDPLDPFTATEDLVSVFNLTPYLHDGDTPISDLAVVVRATNCTVHGQELHFFFTVGGFDRTVTIEVTDDHNRVTAELLVHVEEVNDPPVVHGISPKLFLEDVERTVELEAYIKDEETPAEGLALTCDHPAVIAVTGLNITLLYTYWMEEHTVTFEVFDGIAWSNGSFNVQVQSVNDNPSIVAVGLLTAPGFIRLDEGTVVFLVIQVEDEETSDLMYSLETDWDGIAVYQNGTLRITTTMGELGEFDATLIVDDGDGGIDEFGLAIEVLNVNDPPDPPTILRPANHTEVEEGNNVTFRVEVFDPDMAHGQTLTVTWESNISGMLMTIFSSEPLMFTTNQLAAGSHRITVTANDGKLTRSVWFDITVLKKPDPPKPEEDRSFLTQPTGLVAIGAIIALVLLVVVNLMLAARRRREDEPEAPEEPPAGSIELTVIGGEGKADVTVDLDRSPADREVRKAPEVARATPPSPEPAAPEPPEQLDLETVAPLTEEDLIERAHAELVREVMKVLTQLPRGMPTSLWGKDMANLAKDIVDGPRRSTPDGAMVVDVDGQWYYADHNKLGTFLMEWKGEKEEKADAAPGMTKDELTKRMDQLEDALLDGKISEETYKELKKKYEGG